MMRQHTRAFGWALALAVVALFCTLGHWQWQRMHEKQALLLQADTARARAAALAQALQAPPALRWVHGRGRFLPGVVLLDNQLREGRAGVKVYQAFVADGVPRPVLVDLGWIALPADRTLPAVAALEGEHTLQGLLAPAPSAGLALGPAMAQAGPHTWLATRIDPQAIAQRLQLPAPGLPAQVLRLDPALPLGHVRDLDLLPNTLPPARHLGYAVQWFAMALAVLVLALVLEWRSRRPRSGR